MITFYNGNFQADDDGGNTGNNGIACVRTKTTVIELATVYLYSRSSCYMLQRAINNRYNSQKCNELELSQKKKKNLNQIIYR